jgi:DNA-binding transcriptional ArsR family regulator
LFINTINLGFLLFGFYGYSGKSQLSQDSGTDPAFRRLMVYLFIGTRGGWNRARIVKLLKEEPLNPNQISEKLGLDYKTVQHHIKLLEDNGVIVSSSKGSYGAVYFLTPYVEKHFELLKEIWAKFGQR